MDYSSPMVSLLAVFVVEVVDSSTAELANEECCPVFWLARL